VAPFPRWAAAPPHCPRPGAYKSRFKQTRCLFFWAWKCPPRQNDQNGGRGVPPPPRFFLRGGPRHGPRLKKKKKTYAAGRTEETPGEMAAGSGKCFFVLPPPPPPPAPGPPPAPKKKKPFQRKNIFFLPLFFFAGTRKLFFFFWPFQSRLPQGPVFVSGFWGGVGEPLFLKKSGGELNFFFALERAVFRVDPSPAPAGPPRKSLGGRPAPRPRSLSPIPRKKQRSGGQKPR